MKQCSKCKLTKDLEAFSKCTRAKSGYHSQCKACVKTYHTSAQFKLARRTKSRKRYQGDESYRKQIRDYQKQYRNSDSGREQSRNQINNWLKIPANKIKHRLRTRMYHLLKGIRKTVGSEELIGCSAKQLKYHLESKFQVGMTWDNYGKWHVDHIKPCVNFDLTNEIEQRKCFHFTNLQPLWQHENLSKGILEKPLTTETHSDTL